MTLPVSMEPPCTPAAHKEIMSDRKRLPDETLYARGDPMMNDENFKDYVADRLRTGERRMTGIEKLVEELRLKVEENTSLTARNKADTAEVLGILHAVKGGLKVVGWLGFAIKWTAAVATAGIVLYSAAKGHFPWAK